MPDSPIRLVPPRQPTARESRLGAILLAAREVFSEQGYEQATVSEIARRVGVVEGTVFHYVKNKRGLVLMVIEQFYEELIEKQAAGIESVEGTRERIVFLMRFHLSVLDNHSALCGVILNEGRTVDHSLTKAIRRCNRRYTNSMVAELESGLAKGEVRAGISSTLVRNIIYGTMEQALWAKLADGSTIAVDEMITQLSSVVFTGIGSSRIGGLHDRAQVEALVARLNSLLQQ